MSGTSRPIAFHHFSSVVADLDRSLAFYSDLLGMEVRSRTRCEMGQLLIAGTEVEWTGSGSDWSTEPMDVVLLELGGVRIELAQPRNKGAAPARRPAAGTTHVALKVADVRRLREDLEAAGVQFLTPLLVFPEEGHRPWIWCRCEDPDGHEVELVEEMPTSYQLERMAERLREMRAQRGLTLKEVAARSSISAAHLSQVERGETVPSVPTLLAISSSLGVSPDYFFRAAADGRPLSPNGGTPQPAPGRQGLRAVPRPADGHKAQGAETEGARPLEERTGQTVSGAVEWQWLTAPQAAVKLARICYEAGALTTATGDGAIGSASCAVLEGTLLAEVGSTHNVLAPGSSISYELSTPHRFSNVGDGPAVGLWGFYGGDEPAG